MTMTNDRDFNATDRGSNHGDCHQVVTRLRGYFSTHATRSISFRIEQLKKLRDAIQANEERLLDALRQDLGKPEQEAYLSEIATVQGEIAFVLRNLKKWVVPQRRKSSWLAFPSRATLYPEPYGVALVIAPWNYPFQLLIAPLIGAIAAGNCVCLKPSEYAPCTASVAEEIVQSAFADNYVCLVQGDQQVSKALLSERFDFIFFTGSTNVGRSVLRRAAEHLTPVTLELGGKCPCVVCEDACIETAAKRILWGKLMNAGQTCVAPDYVLVHSHVKDSLLDAMSRTLRDFYSDSPRQSADYGRIVNRRHFQRLIGYLSQGTIAIGGGYDEESLFIEPTVLVNVPPSAPVMQEEIFGPILPIVAYNNEQDAFAELWKSPKPLALYLFTNDRRLQKEIVAKTSSGGVCINDTVVQILGKDLPFGGVGDSGMGTYHGKASFDCFTHYKSVLVRPQGFDFPLRYPPASDSWRRLKRIYQFLMRR